MEDIKIVCRDCGVEFIFTKGEQNFYKERGLHNPVRCKDCRDLRRQNNYVCAAGFEDLYRKFKENTVKIK